MHRLQKLKEQRDFLMNLIKNCEYYTLSEKQSLELINRNLSKPISRSTYYKYKKKLYQDQKFQFLKKSIYKSKILKCLLLYLDERFEPEGFNIDKFISEQFSNRHNILEITEEQEHRILRINKKIKTN